MEYVRLVVRLGAEQSVVHPGGFRFVLQGVFNVFQQSDGTVRQDIRQAVRSNQWLWIGLVSAGAEAR